MTKLVYIMFQAFFLIAGIALIIFAVRDTDYSLAFAGLVSFGTIKLASLLKQELIGIKETKR